MSIAAAVESPVAFAEAVGVELWDYQKGLLEDACRREAARFVTPIVAVSVPRGDGKTFLASLVGAWRMTAGPAPQHILSVALDLDGAKLSTRYARSFLRRLIDSGEVVERADGFEVPSIGSRWEIASREHTSSRGKHPDVVLYDEVGWARDAELFESLLSAQASVEDPLFVVVSTVGPRPAGPLWELSQRAAEGDPAVFWEHSKVNRSPLVTVEYLERMRRLKHPLQFAREHENSWEDSEASYVRTEWVDEAMGRGWVGSVLPEEGVKYFCFVDLGLTRDPTVIALAHEADGLVYVDKITTHQGSRHRPVDLGQVRAELARTFEVWNRCQVRIESWQGVTIGQDLVRSGVRAEVRTPTMTTQDTMWSTLAAELGAGTVVLPSHERLREELLNLTVELRSTGGVRVVDRGRVHQDHAVAVAGAVEMVLAARAQPSGVGTVSYMPAEVSDDRYVDEDTGRMPPGAAEMFGRRSARRVFDGSETLADRDARDERDGWQGMRQQLVAQIESEYARDRHIRQEWKKQAEATAQGETCVPVPPPPRVMVSSRVGGDGTPTPDDWIAHGEALIARYSPPTPVPPERPGPALLPTNEGDEA